MCGLVAFLSKKATGFSIEEGAALSYSMMLNQFRGDDSTGMMCVDNKGGWSYIKSVGGFKSLMNHRGYDDFRKVIMNEGRLVLGHGRAATRGTVTVENAHPFHIKDQDEEIIFMHNGTLHGYQTLEGMHKHSVDSEFLGTMIVKHGAEKALSEIDGAMAVMWWDVKRQTFNFFRNNERPLYFMSTKKGELFLNSEKWILEFINHKYNLKIEDKEIYMLNDMVHNAYKVNGKDAGTLFAQDIKKAKKMPVYSSSWDRGGRYSDTMYDNVYGIRGGVSSYNHYEDYLPAEDKDLWDRSIEAIEWKDGDKITLYRDRRITTEKNCPPPEPNLVRMYEVKHTGDVMKAYSINGNSVLQYKSILYRDFVRDRDLRDLRQPAKKQSQIKPSGKNVQIGGIRGKEIRFTTRSPQKEKVKHIGLILNGSAAPHLSRYENSRDGVVELGMVKNVEVCYVEMVEGSTTMLRVACAEIKEQQDLYIDYVFYTTTYSKDEIERIQFFNGTVGSIMMADHDYALKNGSYGICGLSHVKPIVEIPADESAAQTAAPQAAAASSPSVH